MLYDRRLVATEPNSVLTGGRADFVSRQHSVERAAVDAQNSRRCGDISVRDLQDMMHVALFHLFKTRLIGKIELRRCGLIRGRLISALLAHLAGQIFRHQNRLVRERHSLLNGMLELANVARPATSR